MSPTKLAPEPDRDSAPFWEGCVSGELRAQQCRDCGRWRWPPNEYCPECHSRRYAWRHLAGTGELAAFVVLHRAFDQAFADDIPLAIGHVLMDGTDGVVLISASIVGVDWTELSVGMRVDVEFEPRGETWAVPRFRPKSMREAGMSSPTVLTTAEDPAGPPAHGTGGVR